MVTTPILKFYAELVHNRSQRLHFDVSSPNGILLFRDASKLIVNYGTKILMLGDVSNDQVYAMKLKGISICFQILKLALSGAYVNFGVFQLYGDSALEDALSIVIKMVLSISLSDLLVSLTTSLPNFILICLYLAAISQVEPILLRIARVYCSGPHQFLGQLGAECFPLHHHLAFGWTQLARCLLHGLLFDSRPCGLVHLPGDVQAKQEEALRCSNMSQHCRGEAGAVAANALGHLEHYHLRGLSQPVVNVSPPPGTDSAERRLL